jgi:hypothetical protein
LGPFATVDLTTMRDCVIGTFSYIQAGEIGHLNVGPGTVWVRAPDKFNFLYRHPLDKLSRYIKFIAGRTPQGFIMDFLEDRKGAFQSVFDVVNIGPSVPVPPNASLDRYAVIKPKTRISENVLIAQRAYLQNAFITFSRPTGPSLTAKKTGDTPKRTRTSHLIQFSPIPTANCKGCIRPL